MTKKLLVADDSATIQKVIKIAFSRYSVRVIEAATLMEAMRAATSHHPEAILVDANLVGSNGPDDIKKLQDSAGGCPVLVLAGTYEAVDLDQFRNRGLRHILQKPFDTKDIITKVVDDLGIVLDSINIKSDMIPPPMSRVSADAPPPSLSPELRISLADAASPLSGDPFESLRSTDSTSEGPLPFTDATARGTRAFSGRQSSSTSVAGSQPPQARTAPLDAKIPGRSLSQRIDEIKNQVFSDQRPSEMSAGRGDRATLSREEIRDLLTPMLRDEVQVAVSAAVLEYCSSHFNELAKTIIMEELRRLADEKSRHLLDH